MRASLICTVKDEADNVAALLDSMLAQTRPPDEIVVNDCGSTDATAAIVCGYVERGSPVRLVHGGHNIASGRNNAIRHAAGPLVASTDAGLTLDPAWLARLLAPLESGQADLVAGFFEIAPHTVRETAIGCTNFPTAADVDPDQVMAVGASSAFRKQVWEAVGGYPEWADHCEDLLLDQAVRAAGFRRVAALDAVVRLRPRSSLRALARQYYSYARGDGLAGLWPRRHAVRYTTYATLLVVLGVAVRRPWALLVLPPGIAAYTRAPYRRCWRATAQAPTRERVAVLALVPVVRLVGDLAKMAGYPAGRVVRARRRLGAGA